jgi:hypothetical protein
MKKLVLISFSLISILGFSQKHADELAVVKVKVAKSIDVTVMKHEVMLVPALGLKASIETGFKTANAKTVSLYFASNIDVSLLDKENLYSKSQAEQVLKTFFLENKPTKFTFVHQGKASTTKYYIGSLQTVNGGFRITVNTKITNGKELISHLSNEKED